MLNSATATQSKTQPIRGGGFRIPWQLVFTGSLLSIVTLMAGVGSPFLQRWERQVQTLFFELRGPQPAPDDIVILAIDNESLSQAEHYQSDPEAYPFLASIEKFPWQRQAYAIAIDRLMQAGAKAISLDVILSATSGYGPEDDQALVEVLEKYGDRITLAMQYEDDALRQGALLNPTLPIKPFQETGIHLGTINFLLEPDGRIHRQGHAYIQLLESAFADLDDGTNTATDWDEIYSLPEATLNAAQVPYSEAENAHIHFLGPAQTFERVPFWYVLDPNLWQNYLDSGAFFKDKIILIGSTATVHQDFHRAPFSETLLYPSPLPGVEILANDIATLRAGNALTELIPLTGAKVSGLVLCMGIGLVIFIWGNRSTLYRLGGTFALFSGWLLISYVSFTALNLFLPTASVALSIAVVGGCQTASRLISERLRKQRLRKRVAEYATSPLLQDIFREEEDFQDILQMRQAKVVGSLLGTRYQVLEVLGSGGFSETYTAVDTQRPKQPVCVVKQLRIASDDPEAHQLAHRLFASEAETLEQLGHHSQIPMLLAHFEMGSAFYLVEEMVQGTTLKVELSPRQPKSQAWVMNFLLDILPVVEFVHSQGVIHRDIKPSNMIRRAGDGRLVLIDFGSVKQISNQVTEPENHVTSTIGIGTKGYMPSEQSAGLPRFSSDLYAIGVTAIEALTGVSPDKLTYDDRGEIIWQYRVPELNPHLANVLNKMVRYDFSQRYSSVTEVLVALREIPITLPDSILIEQPAPINPRDDDFEEDDRWDEPTGFLPTDWMMNSAEKNSQD